MNRTRFPIKVLGKTEHKKVIRLQESAFPLLWPPGAFLCQHDPPTLTGAQESALQAEQPAGTIETFTAIRKTLTIYQ